MKLLKSILKFMGGVFLLLVVVAIFAPDSDTAAKPAAEPAATVVPEPVAMMDPDALAAYVQEAIQADVDSEALYVDTILLEPIEIEVRQLSERGPVYLTAWVKEYALGAQARQITTAAVGYALDWLISEGLNPYADKMTVACRIQMPEKGATGQEMVRTWGRSVYDYSNDSIAFETD